jgi:glycerol-1-phosphate dehydrogenase [NAD(P)+]
MIRSRYTVLDLAYETGILDEIVQELFAPGGYWAQEPAADAS